MEWTESLSVGVGLIDSQHQELISRLNSFYASLKNGDKQEEVLKMLKFMESYVKQHFADEENLQLKYSYPGYAAQVAAHRKFEKDIAGIRADMEKSGFSSATALVVGSTLSNWLLSHIGRMDRELGAYLKGKF